MVYRMFLGNHALIKTSLLPIKVSESIDLSCFCKILYHDSKNEKYYFLNVIDFTNIPSI